MTSIFFRICLLAHRALFSISARQTTEGVFFTAIFASAGLMLLITQTFPSGPVPGLEVPLLALMTLWLGSITILARNAMTIWGYTRCQSPYRAAFAKQSLAIRSPSFGLYSAQKTGR